MASSRNPRQIAMPSVGTVVFAWIPRLELANSLRRAVSFSTVLRLLAKMIVERWLLTSVDNCCSISGQIEPLLEAAGPEAVSARSLRDQGLVSNRRR